MAPPVFHGSLAESYRLAQAVANNCTCQPSSRCEAHAAMLDQRFIDGVLFARFLLPLLRRQEFGRSALLLGQSRLGGVQSRA